MKVKSATALVASSFTLLVASLSVAQTQPTPPTTPPTRPFGPGLVRPGGPRTTRPIAPIAPTNPAPAAPAAPASAPSAPAPAAGGAPPGGPSTPSGPGTPGLNPPGAPSVPQSLQEAAPGGGLHEFGGGVEYHPLPAGARLAFTLQDADLPDLIRAVGNITGKRFIIGKNARSIKATIFSPTRVTPGELYQAFLSVLDTNGLTARPDRGFVVIEDSAGAAGRPLPTSTDTEGSTQDNRFITRIHRLRSIGAEDGATLLGHFKSHDGDVVPYPATNTVIITDTGANIRRMMQILEEVDVPSVGLQIWVERIHYANASDMATRINDLLSPSGGAGHGEHAAGATGAPAGPVATDTRLARLLPDDRSNSLIIVATERMYLRVLDLIRALDVPVEGEGEVHVYYLQHADADELSTTLNSITGRGAPGAPGAPAAAASPAGGAAARVSGVFEGTIRITADKRTNALVVTSSPRDYASVRHVISELDRARRQVFIEAVVMELSVNNTSKLGVSWHGGAPTPPDGSLAIGGFQAANSVGFPTSLLTNQDALQGLAIGVRGPPIQGTQALGFSVGIPEFGAVLNALASSGDVDVLGTPTIIATDNSPADINVGQNIALQQNAGSGLSPLAALAGATGAGGATGGLGALGGFGGFAPPRQDVGTKLKIVPHINDSNEIRLEIDEEISQAGDPQGALGVIPIQKRTAKTTVVVQDQQTVVIGGLIQNTISRGTTRIPILGDIPLLGILFRTETRTVQRTNLVLFLTPYVIRDQSDLRRIFERKMRERQEFLDRYFVFSESQDYHPVIDYTRTNGLVEEIREAIRDIRVQTELEERAIPRPPPPHAVSEPIELPEEIHTPDTAPGPAGAGPPAAGAPGASGPGPPLALPAGALPAPMATPPAAAPTPAAPAGP